jgi:hypothetical protein
MPIAGSYRQYNLPELHKKWNQWLTGIKSDEMRDAMAVLLENQHAWNKKEAPGLLKEAVTTSDVGTFQKVILPVVRRVFPRLIAPELVGMQPMSGPHGLAIFLKYFYGNASDNDQILKPQGNVDGRRVNFREYQGTQWMEKTAAGAPANTITYDFSVPNVGATSPVILPSSAAGGGVIAPNPTGNAWFGPATFRFNVTVTNHDSSTATDTIVVYNTAPYNSYTSSGQVPSWAIRAEKGNIAVSFGSAPDAVNAVSCSAAPTDYTLAGLKFTFLCKTDGTMTVNPQPVPYTTLVPNATTSNGVFNDAVFIDSTGCPIIASRGLENQTPASLSVAYETKPITAETFKLQAAWSLEANQDVGALHGESLEEILANLLTQELMNETDYTVVNDLLSIAGLVQTWGRYPGVITGLSGSGTTSMPAFRGNLQDHYQTLIMAMNDMANGIFTRILRGPANFAVCAPDVSAIIENINGFKSAEMGDLDNEAGIVNVGSYQSKYKIYKDARLPKGTMLMGYKGKDATSTGYVFAPYIPATLSPVIWNPTTYAQSRMIMTRFGRTTLMDGQFFYGRILVTENAGKATSDFSAV